jgi:ABC-type transport system involved in multi-copper enzyme maturation permease subunit
MMPASPLKHRNLREVLLSNPVVLKELRGRMRGHRAFVVLTIYLALMSAFVGILYIVFALTNDTPATGAVAQQAGKFVFFSVVGFELLLVCFIGPAFTAGAISIERERQTFDLLRTTLLSAASLVVGKLTSALSYILILLVAAFPLQTLAFLLGGVAVEEILIGAVLLIATAFLFGTSGLFFSSIMRRTLGSTVLTYAFALLVNLALPIVLMATIPFGNFFFGGYSGSQNELFQILLAYSFGFGICLNPVATMIASEVILLEEHTVFYFTTTIAGNSWPFVSPWLPYVFFCALGTLIFILGSILAVGQTERQ